MLGILVVAVSRNPDVLLSTEWDGARTLVEEGDASASFRIFESYEAV